MKTSALIRIGVGKQVQPHEVVLLNADTNYTEIILANGRKYLTACTLKSMEQRFADCPNFFRPHKSFVINLNHVKSVDFTAADDYIEMQNGYRVSISRRRRTAFKKRLQMTSI